MLIWRANILAASLISRPPRPESNPGRHYVTFYENKQLFIVHKHPVVTPPAGRSKYNRTKKRYGWKSKVQGWRALEQD